MKGYFRYKAEKTDYWAVFYCLGLGDSSEDDVRASALASEWNYIIPENVAPSLRTSALGEGIAHRCGIHLHREALSARTGRTCPASGEGQGTLTSGHTQLCTCPSSRARLLPALYWVLCVF